MRQRKCAQLWPIVGMFFFACVSPPLESPKTSVTQQTPVRVPQNIKDKVDILFLVDNSNSMSAMTEELKNRFSQFLKVFQELAASGKFVDLHIGVVTSDYGAGTGNAPGCTSSPGGQMGRLQAVGAAADAKCKPPKPVDGKTANYISYKFTGTDGSGVHNLPDGQDLVKTFTCMASAGAMGCGFEHQLEAVYAALHNNLPENKDFLRNGEDGSTSALLTVVFLTNEDDGSAPSSSDVFDKNKVAQYGYESSYRQTRWGVQCDGSSDAYKLAPYGDSGGPLAGCHAALNPSAAPDNPGGGPGREYEISRYINLFNNPSVSGGVKPNPADVILVGIDAASDPFSVILSNPGTSGGAQYVTCPQLNEGSNPPCVPVLQHSCQNPAQPSFFGDPAVRLNAVINAANGGAAANHYIASICDADYTPALQAVAQKIIVSLGGGCIVSPLPDPKNPDCTAQDVTRNLDGTTTSKTIPRCDGSNTYPCWKVHAKKLCGAVEDDGNCDQATNPIAPQCLGVTIDRGGMQAPDNTEAQVACTTVAG